MFFRPVFLAASVSHDRRFGSDHSRLDPTDRSTPKQRLVVTAAAPPADRLGGDRGGAPLGGADGESAVRLGDRLMRLSGRWMKRTARLTITALLAGYRMRLELLE